MSIYVVHCFAIIRLHHIPMVKTIVFVILIILIIIIIIIIIILSFFPNEV